jgi:DNA polymerase III alpha subunit (gram-positive type)
MKIVYYDLETTGFNHAAVQICSIGAIYRGQEFHRYLIPTCSIPRAATNIHGMSKVNGYLYLNGRLVEEAVPIDEGLEDFLVFLEENVCQNDARRKVLLVGKINVTFELILFQIIP